MAWNSSYDTVRDTIKGIIQTSVPEIKIVYPYLRYSNSEETFYAQFVDEASSRINILWFDRESKPQEREMTGSAATDERSFLHYTETVDYWQMEFYFGFKDAPVPDVGTPEEDYPSAILFQRILEKLETAFRFAQDLNGYVLKSHPLIVLETRLVMLGGYLCHRAVCRLELNRRIKNTA